MLTEIRLTHIRQHDHYDKDPTAKDEVLTLSRWLMLEVYEDFSSNCINTPYTQRKSEQRHLLGEVSLTVNDRYSPVDIRQYLKPEDAEEQPYSMKKGVQRTREQTNKLLDNMKVIRDMIPELSQIFPCYMNEDHQHLIGMVLRRECNPLN